MDRDHLPFLLDLGIRHDLAYPGEAQRAVFGLERNYNVPPGIPRVANIAVLEIKRCDRQLSVVLSSP
jgi:hypothetical protein